MAKHFQESRNECIARETEDGCATKSSACDDESFFVHIMKPFSKLTSWSLMLPDWCDPSGRLQIRTMIGVFLWNVLAIFGLVIIGRSTVESFIKREAFTLNIKKISIISMHLLAITGHTWYLFKWRAMQRLFVSFRRLECSLRVELQQDFQVKVRKGSRNLYIHLFFSWLSSIIGPLILMTIAINEIYSGNSSSASKDKYMLFELIPVLNLPVGVVLQVVSFFYIFTTWSLMEQMPMVVYYYVTRVIRLTAVNVRRTFDLVAVVDEPVSERFLQLWANHEHLSRLNGEIGIIYGLPNFLSHIMDFMFSWGIIYALLKTEDDAKVHLVVLWFIIAARLVFNIVVGAKVGGASADLVETFADLASRNAKYLTDREMMTVNSFLQRLQNNKISTTLINLYYVNYSLLLAMLNIGVSLILLILSNS